MVTSKPKWGAKYKPLHAFKPTDKEFESIIQEIERHAKKKLKDTSKEELLRLVTLTRSKISCIDRMPNRNELIAEFKQIKKSVENVYNMIDLDNISDPLRSLMSQYQIITGLVDEKDSLWCIHHASKNFINTLSPQVENHLEVSSNIGYELIKARLDVSIQFAKILVENDIPVKSTVESDFSTTLESFLIMLSFQIDNNSFNIPTPEDMHKLVLEVVKNHPEESKLSILDLGAKFPGL
ncbi:MAG: hypothetical protein ACI9TY_000163 [Alphaproteobacteria bacterium]|jgi:hypothetical protein